jgi:aminoglycoside 6-adenylyltransferase
MDTILDKLVTWAQGHPDVRAVLLVGSRAREEFPGDEWADTDLECFVTALPVDASSQGWLEKFGNVWTFLYTQFEDGTPHPLVVFEGGEKFDFSFEPVAALEQLVAEQRLHDSQQRGYRILIDKDGLAAKLPPPQLPVFQPPTEAEFLVSVRGFWFGAMYVAKQIRRRNLWVVKFRDWTIKMDLLKMLEWHFETTWHDGHFMSSWVSPEVKQALDHTFGPFDAEGSWKALLATMHLFKQITPLVAQHHQFEYPEQTVTEITNFIENLYAQDTHS